jgi:bacteriocin biosynthesis cyclodehydratase domain-containing protein
MGRAAASGVRTRARAARPVLLVGDDTLTESLAQDLRPSLGAHPLLLDLPERTPLIAIAAFWLRSAAAHRDFERQALTSGMAVLSVTVEDDATLIGPLAHPLTPGCGHCARLRIVAACAARGATLRMSTSRAAWSPRAVQQVLACVRAVMRHGNRSRRLVRHVHAIDAATSALSRHAVVPMPYCEVCGGAAAIPPNRRPTTGLKDWVDARTGVITSLKAESPADTGLDLPLVVTAAPPHIADADGNVRRLPVGWGKGLTPSDALLSAVGEAIERYAPSLPDRSQVVEARPCDLDAPHLDPAAFALYSDAQYARRDFPCERYDADLAHPWIRGWWSVSGEPVWVHTAFVYLSIEMRRHQFICQGSSNGLAASLSIEDAASRATMELVERDALMHAWLTGTPGRLVTLDNTLDPPLRQIVHGIERHGAAVEVYALETAACGTVVLCLSLGDGEHWPGATLALGAGMNPRAAVRQAILELGQTGPHLLRLMQRAMWPTPAAATDVRDMLDHAAYYFAPDRRRALDRLRGGSTSMTLSDLARTVPTDLSDCQSALAAAGIRVAIVDVTTPDVRTSPFRVARAVSPDLQSISYGFGLERLPVARIDPTELVAGPGVHPIW